ncbi:acetyl/propionyl/methylcrotonyl-CoA carboxylase subunit alpha [Modestobacter excelsi]|uniref:acetyl/propionyl/methylcrotonyl-CoA carboxylase subunit alpha n=1 Tax=Modestobacter excelsi TaxID=2213161 RepID=UPI001C20E785|nr:biotin carboxylase N-terminal domain-containing protein [Modestobacter excelsi]
MKLLIANRGEIARRIMRTAREMGVSTVAAYVDADASSPFVREADEAYRLTRGSYLDAEELVGIAVAAGADAVHPGYGFLSERPGFATAVVEAGLTWVGPEPAVISAMGDKIRARELAVAAGVPVLPAASSADDVSSVGFPVLVKASAGGGGKGMRIVWTPDELQDAVAAAQREAKASFGDETVFVERYVARSRHIEIQVLGDQHGSVVHLGERECSIQRRHQKIIEESPAARLHPDTRERMIDSAVSLARSLGYTSAGTVEFLVEDDAESEGPQEYYFLEVNTRLQVEHPVTEAVFGVDLVREQLRIADGEPLGYEQDDLVQRGHAIEARIYAEDPRNEFLPATGTLVGWQPDTDGIRWDSGVEEGFVLSTHFDPMLAKVIAYAPTRTAAALRLARALAHSQIAGVTTNREFLVDTLRQDAFLAGDTTTDFIERIGPAPRLALRPTDLRNAACAAVMWEQERRRRQQPVLGFMRPGWRNSSMGPQRTRFSVDDETLEIAHTTQRDGSARLEDGTTVRVLVTDDRSITVQVGDELVRARIAVQDDVVHVDGGAGQVVLRTVSPFPTGESSQSSGAVRAPMPGSVIGLLVGPADPVEKGQVVAILEAMKMEHRLKAGAAGAVTAVHVSVGDQVELGSLLLEVAADEVAQ